MYHLNTSEYIITGGEAKSVENISTFRLIGDGLPGVILPEIA